MTEDSKAKPPRLLYNVNGREYGHAKVNIMFCQQFLQHVISKIQHNISSLPTGEAMLEKFVTHNKHRMKMSMSPRFNV